MKNVIKILKIYVQDLIIKLFLKRSVSHLGTMRRLLHLTAKQCFDINLLCFLMEIILLLLVGIIKKNTIYILRKQKWLYQSKITPASFSSIIVKWSIELD